MMRGAAWIADYPDGDNFMQLLYGPNSGQSNNACYRSEEYDRRYERSRLLPDGPERDTLYHEMARLAETNAPLSARLDRQGDRLERIERCLDIAP